MTSFHPRFDFVPTSLAVKAMRDNGYKNAAHAIAELVDNSIQAGADSVELMCTESEEQLASRRRRRIQKIAVLDNGSGMDADILRMSLQFGNGSYLNDRSGIGRFGMGLPTASISQCRRLDVWSWQSGPENSLHTYLDLGEIERGEVTEVPEPTINAIPDYWASVGSSYGKSGTLVVWSELDRCQWRTARAVIDNSEEIIGRMYRRFINSGQIAIRLVTFRDGDIHPELEKFAEANDPTYRMTPTSTPAPYRNAPMFEQYGERWEVRPKISYNGEEHEVVIRFSVAESDARKQSTTGGAAGSLPHGRHAGRNVGISIMRAGRELELDQSWVNTYDPRERWWGIEVEFPPALDDIFGVTNNKQSARYFSQTPDISALLEDGITVEQLKQELREDEDPRGPLIEISERIKQNLGPIRRLIADQARHLERITRRRNGGDSPEERGTRATRKRQEEGHKGASDLDESLPEHERISSLEEGLVEGGMPPEQAKMLAASTVSSGMKYMFSQAALETSAFFSVRSRGGALSITLNTSHPAFTHLMEVLDDSQSEGLSEEDTALKLTNAWRGLRLLLEAWARYEDEQPDGTLRQRVQDARADWGRVARQFMEDE